LIKGHLVRNDEMVFDLHGAIRIIEYAREPNNVLQSLISEVKSVSFTFPEFRRATRGIRTESAMVLSPFAAMIVAGLM